MIKYSGLDRIMLIDDDEATNYLNEAMIASLDIDVETLTFFSASEALNYIRNVGEKNAINQNKPDLIFLDINMPGMNGWDFLEEYNKLDELKKAKVLIVMLTTSLNPDDEELAKQNETIRYFFNKPLAMNKVKELIESNFNKE